jgi:hypothetical protein
MMSTDQDDVRGDYEYGCKGLRTGTNVRHKVGGDMAACCNTNEVLVVRSAAARSAAATKVMLIAVRFFPFLPFVVLEP